jgi:predicted transcriptional regulator
MVKYRYSLIVVISAFLLLPTCAFAVNKDKGAENDNISSKTTKIKKEKSQNTEKRPPILIVNESLV